MSLMLHSDVAEFFWQQGLRSVADFFALDRGEIVGGHWNRNVARVEIGSIRGFLKREYRTVLKDRFESWWAGFGFVSKSVREWKTLMAMRARGIACPNPLAAGEAQGQAFLLVEDLGDYMELTTHLQASHPNWAERRWLAHMIGKAVAGLHAAGFTHPDLYAKHIFVARNGQRVALIDVQRTRRFRSVGWQRRWRDLAALDASLADLLVDPRERLVCLRAYLRHALLADAGGGRPGLRWRSLIREAITSIGRRTRHLLRRRKVRRMRGTAERQSDALILDYWRLAVREESTLEPTVEPTATQSTRRWQP